MALQLLKRNYTMCGGGYDVPKILKLPQGEERWAPRRLPVDVGDIMMNIRMDDAKNKYIGEHVSKYAQGLNPYGEWGYPYKINKNNIRPPIIDPKYYAPLSRMPVKFDSVSSGPIVKDLYGKRVEIGRMNDKFITDKICTDVGPRVSAIPRDAAAFREGSIELHNKQPKASIPYHPSMPVHVQTGVPQIELDAKMIVRPNMGIHAPFSHSDQTRDVHNMRTPMHVAVQPGFKAPYVAEPVDAPIPTMPNLDRTTMDLTPKLQTSAWYNPSYSLIPGLSGYSIGTNDQVCDRIKTSAAANPSLDIFNQVDRKMNEKVHETILHASAGTNIAGPFDRNGVTRLGNAGGQLTTPLPVDSFTARASVPVIQEHQAFNRTRDTGAEKEYFFVNGTKTLPSIRENIEANLRETTPLTSVIDASSDYDLYTSNNKPQTGIRNKLTLQQPQVIRTGLEPPERVVPVGVGRFVYPTV